MSARLRIAALAAALACAATGAQAVVMVGAGSALNFADANVSLGCGDLTVQGQTSGTAANVTAIANLVIAAGGTLAPGASQLTLGGNFADAGTFTPGTSRVAIVDTCGSGTSTVSGATSFYDLIVATASGKRLVLPAALTQSIAHALTLQGAAGNLLQVLSSSAGQQALLDVGAGAAQSIAYVDARDNKASGAAIAPGAAASYQSVDGGNLLNWFAAAAGGPGGATVPAPLLGAAGGVALIGILFALAWAALRHRPQSA